MIIKRFESVPAKAAGSKIINNRKDAINGSRSLGAAVEDFHA
jgi:hypothetical protein